MDCNATLNERQKTCVRMREAGHAYRDIAADLNIGVARAKNIYRRAKQKQNEIRWIQNHWTADLGIDSLSNRARNILAAEDINSIKALREVLLSGQAIRFPNAGKLVIQRFQRLAFGNCEPVSYNA